jgi:hypothetical protein
LFLVLLNVAENPAKIRVPPDFCTIFHDQLHLSGKMSGYSRSNRRSNWYNGPK